jgi:hypothetical protein
MNAPGIARSTLLALLALGALPARGENIDPAGIGAQYAWGENVGWLNGEPFGDSGPGLEVDDFEVTGWLWGENVGWISASCKNTGSCEAVPYGVRNDGAGNLSGFAWAENAGWIDFAPAHGGVRIEPATGTFDGLAWGENIGWLSFTFGSASGSMERIRTEWSCDTAAPPPTGIPWLTLAKAPAGSGASLAWVPSSGATGYDVVFGDLGTLVATRGDFSAATRGCAADNDTLSSLDEDHVLASGEGVWFLVRGVNCSGSGTYDTGSLFQLGSRDEGIRASGNGCP